MKTIYLAYSCLGVLILKSLIFIGKNSSDASTIASLILWLVAIVCFFILLLRKGTFAERMKRSLPVLIAFTLYVLLWKPLDQLTMYIHFQLNENKYEAFAEKVVDMGERMSAKNPGGLIYW